MLRVAIFRGTASWLSKAIEWDTRSPFCHAAVLLGDGTLIESIEPTGVRERAFVPNVNEPADLFTVPGLNEAAAGAFLRVQVGKPYAMMDLLGFITRDGKDEDRGAWFCSELVFAALEAGGVTPLINIPPFMVSPGLLALSPLLIPCA